MRICLAPMDGITDCAYRIVCKEVFERHGHPNDELMLRTEFMSADGYCHNPPGVVKHLMKTDYEPELIAQIFWGNEQTLLACAQDIEQKYSFAGVELNMGCPSPKVMKCEAGSWMLKDKKKTLEILSHMAMSLQKPFSLKTRCGLTQDDIDAQFDFLLEASAHVRMIIIHGRTYSQSHSGEVNRDFIYRLKEHLPDKIIIGNGGIRSYKDAEQHLHTLDGIMIAQSAIGNPRILTPHLPTPQEKITVIMRHLNLAMACEYRFEKMIVTMQDVFRMPTLSELNQIANDISTGVIPSDETRYTPREMRKFLFAYITGLPDNKALKQEIIKTRTYDDLRRMLEQYFDNLPQDFATVPVPPVRPAAS